MRLLALVLSAALLGAAGCGGEPAKAPVKKETGPSWTDVFASTPDIYAVVRPQALKKDAIYGAFWRSLVAGAQARGLARGATMTEAIEGAEEIIVGVNANEAALVFRGVPARLDPKAITGEDGRPMFHAISDERKKIVEYEITDKKLAAGGALFVLPDRTWVGVLGDTRERARAAFASPTNQPAPEVNAGAPISVQIRGGFLRLFERHSLLGPLTKKLTKVTLELQPGSGGVVIALAYSAADATAFGEMEAKKIANDLAKSKSVGWLKEAKIAYEGNTVFIRVSVPPRLLEELPKAQGSDLGL